MSVIENLVLDPADRHIYLSSEYAIKNQNDTSDCIFRMSSNVSTSNDNYVMGVAVRSVSIPHTYYNMYGNNFKITANGVTHILTLPSGQYTSTSLASSVQTLVRNAFSWDNFVCEYRSDVNQFRFYDLESSPEIPFTFEYTESNCYYELGLKNLFYGATSQVSSTWLYNSVGVIFGTAIFNNVGPSDISTFWNLATNIPSKNLQLQCADLSGFHGVYIGFANYNCASLTSYNQLQQTNVLARIPIASAFGSIDNYEPATLLYHYFPNAMLSELHFVLLGDDGQRLNMNGVDWCMSLHVKYFLKTSPEVEAFGMIPGASMREVQMLGGRRVI